MRQNNADFTARGRSSGVLVWTKQKQIIKLQNIKQRTIKATLTSLPEGDPHVLLSVQNNNNKTTNYEFEKEEFFFRSKQEKQKKH